MLEKSILKYAIEYEWKDLIGWFKNPISYIWMEGLVLRIGLSCDGLGP